MLSLTSPQIFCFIWCDEYAYWYASDHLWHGPGALHLFLFQTQDYTESNNNHMLKKLGTPFDRLYWKVMNFASGVHEGLGGCGGNKLTKQFAFLFSWTGCTIFEVIRRWPYFVVLCKGFCNWRVIWVDLQCLLQCTVWRLVHGCTLSCFVPLSSSVCRWDFFGIGVQLIESGIVSCWLHLNVYYITTVFLFMEFG